MLYGSQTGNAESIAVELSERLTELGIQNKCDSLNSAKKIPLKEQALALVIVCSTTGNGDAPENAEAWWRSVKLRSAVSITILVLLKMYLQLVERTKLSEILL